MKIIEGVRKHAAEQGIAEAQALKKGWKKSPASSWRRETRFTRRREWTVHRHCPVSVKADQKKGSEKSSLAPLERISDNCASRHACTRGSPARQRRMNSVINRLVARSLTFQWLASTVSAPAMRKARRNDIRPSPIFTSPRAKSNCYPGAGIVVPKGCYPLALVFG